MRRSSLTNVNLIYHHTDGEGRSVRRDIYKQTNGYNTFEKTEYSIYSSVLGKALTEVKSDATKKKTNVYGAGGQVIATQNALGTTSQHVAWNNIDPSSASYLPILHGGGANYLGEDGQAELDPLGSNVQTSNPFANQPELMQAPGGGGWGDPFGGYGCRMDGFDTPCSQVMFMLSVGAAEPVWNHDQPIFLGHWEPDNREGAGDRFVPFPFFGGLLMAIDNQISCDKRLARIFGGPDTVMATKWDLNGILPAIGNMPERRKPTFNREFVPNPEPRAEDPRVGVVHLYSNKDGTAANARNAFAPEGYEMGAKYDVRMVSETGNFIRLYYKAGSLSEFGYDGGLTVNFTHIGPTNAKGEPDKPDRNAPRNGMGSVSVGILGGGQGSNPNLTKGSLDYWVHSHMIFNEWDGKSVNVSDNTRIDPRRVFCKNLGF